MRSTTPPTTPRVLPPYPQHALLFGALALGALVAGQPAAAENRASIGTSRSPQAAIGQLADADCAAALQACSSIGIGLASERRPSPASIWYRAAPGS